MPNAPLNNVLRQIRRLVARPNRVEQSDEELLERFVVSREEEAFASLVRRHGPMVLGVCLRLLRNRHDAEDAFQATFLTLVRKGSTIRQRGALASWLYRVAFRISLRLKARAEKRSTSESLGDAAVELDPATEASWHELRPLLDAELQELPAKYRAPMILCYLEGRTYEQVAIELGCPKGTVAIRLLRAREMLKRRLIRRGLVAAAGIVTTHSLLPGASAAVPAGLATTTTSIAVNLAGGATLAAAAPAGVAALVQEVGRTWIQQKLNAVYTTAACICLSSLGVGGSAIAVVNHRPPPVTTRNVPVYATAPMLTPQRAPDFAPAPCQPWQICFCIVELQFGQGTELIADSPSTSQPTKTTRAANVTSKSYVTLQVPEEAIDTVREVGSVVLQPRNVSRTMVVLVHSNPDTSRRNAKSGLALRENLLDDPVSSRCGAPELPLPETPNVAKRPATKRPPRLIAVTHQGQLNLFAGMLRLVFLRPVNPPQTSL